MPRERGGKGKINEEQEIIEPEVITEVEEVKQIKDNAIANIHNNLIQARHKLSLEEIRLMDTIISLIQPEDEDFKRYKIPVSIFQELYGTQRKDIYDVVKRAVEGLLSKPIKLESKNDRGKKVFEMFNFISYGKYEEGEGNFYIEIASSFKPYLLKLKEFFSRIPIKYTYVLTSRYSIRLYELLKQYQETGFRIDKIEDLREMLGVEEHEYKAFKDFEKWVLKRAINEINEKTDLQVSYVKKKTGRKITHIEFYIEQKQGYPTETTKMPSQSLDTQGSIKGISETSTKTKKFDKDSFWNEVKEYRKKYMEILQEYNDWVKQTKISNPKIPVDRYLTENQLLFLLINAEENGYPANMVVNAVKKAVLNKQVKNPMGFLIDFFDIDMFTANYTELTTTDEMPDKELIESEVKQGQQQAEKDQLQTEYEKNKAIFEKHNKVSQSFVNAFLKTVRELDELGDLKPHLIEMLTNTVVDKENQTLYVPAPDYTLLDWFDINFKEELENFIKSKTGKDFSVEVVLYSP